MHKRNLFATAALLASAAVFSGCSQKTGPAFDLSLRLQPQMKRLFRITQDLKRTGGPEGGAKSRQNVREFSFDIESVSPEGIAEVKITTDLSEMAPLMGNGGSGGNPFADLGTVTLSARLAPDGTLSDVRGLDAVLKKALANYRKTITTEMQEAAEAAPPGMALPYSAEEVADKAARSITRILNEGAVAQIQSLTDLYPGRPVWGGESWTRVATLWKPFPTEVTTTYTVQARNENTTDLSFEASLASVAGARLDYGIGAISAEITGKEVGTVQIDNATGWPVLRSARCSIERLMAAGSGQFPLNDVGTVHVQSYEQ